MVALTPETLTASLAALSERPLDVLVIGGGITGAGVALDAASRGLGVGLVEREDIASGTSGRSTRVSSAWFRESLRERAIPLRLAPHLVRPLPFLLPARGSAQRGWAAIGLGLYGFLAPGRPPPAPLGGPGRGAAAGPGHGPAVGRLRPLGLPDR